MAKAKRAKETDTGELLVCRNPKALHDYDIEDRLEAGLVLTGSEVKSLRARRADIESAYASIDDLELYLHGMHIAPYEQAGAFGHEPKRKRKLLVHKQEVKRLLGKLAQRGYTLVALRVYFKDGRAKIELGVGKGKKLGDRRQDLRREADMREARAAMSRSGKHG
jgi:SsrA-binding protein